MTPDPFIPSLPQDLESALVGAEPQLGPFKRRILWFPVVPSTNDMAAALAERGAEEGCVVIADAQSAGRGRHGRVWASPPGAGLYVSAILRPSAAAMPLVTLAAGVALADGIQAASGLSPVLKWPNDVYLGTRKVAGILAEGGVSPAGAHHVVLGFGINVLPAALPPGISARATSLEGELGRPVDRGLLLACCLSALAERYLDLQAGHGAAVLDAWRARGASLLGRPVEWDADGKRARGVAQDIDEAGALLVRTETGIVRVIAGEVRWM